MSGPTRTDPLSLACPARCASSTGIDIPVVLDVDCGHVPPHLALVNGALAHLTMSGSVKKLDQVLD